MKTIVVDPHHSTSQSQLTRCQKQSLAKDRREVDKRTQNVANNLINKDNTIVHGVLISPHFLAVLLAPAFLPAGFLALLPAFFAWGLLETGLLAFLAAGFLTALAGLAAAVFLAAGFLIVLVFEALALLAGFLVVVLLMAVS
jgi:hypothetical protein